MRIAKVFTGSPGNHKGFFNNVMERTSYLKNINPDIDCYLIRIEPGFMGRLLKGKLRKDPRPSYEVVNGIKLNNIWINLSILDYILTYRLNLKITCSPKQLHSHVNLFSNYDLLSTHGVEANEIALKVKKKYNTPFVTTWHGSDINIRAFKNNILKKRYISQIEQAFHNFFVSQHLLEKSKKLTLSANKSVLYTGPSKSFYRYRTQQKELIKHEFGITTKYAIGFIGNLIEIKNILILPSIFLEIQKKVRNISFIIVGDGPLEESLIRELKIRKIENIHILGKQPRERMPDIMNCLDVLLLPSLNEGLPRVTLEAQATGVHVVASNRGGITESVNPMNCFELDKNFIKNASSRVIDIINSDNNNPSLQNKFSSTEAARIELQTYNKAIVKD